MPDKNIPSVEELANGVEKVANSYQKNPMGTTIALSVLMLIIGIFFGRHTASTEIESATKRAEESQKVLNQILMGSLEKNQVIRVQKDNIQIKTNENDTLQNKLNQVGEALMIAKPAAVKILNK